MRPPELGAVVAIPQVAGLHHRYERARRLNEAVLPNSYPRERAVPTLSLFDTTRTLSMANRSMDFSCFSIAPGKTYNEHTVFQALAVGCLRPPLGFMLGTNWSHPRLL